MARYYTSPTDTTEEYDPLGAGSYLAGALSTGAAGAAIGSEFSPLGTAIGGLAGAGYGLYQASQANKQQEAAYEQQQQLEEELANVGEDIELQRQDQSRALGAAEPAARIQARQQSAAAGLSPAAALSLEQQSVSDLRGQAAQAQGSLAQAASQQKLAEQASILQQYELAQALATQVGTANEPSAEVLSALGSGVALAGSLKGSKPEAPTTEVAKSSVPSLGEVYAKQAQKSPYSFESVGAAPGAPSPLLGAPAGAPSAPYTLGGAGQPALGWPQAPQVAFQGPLGYGQATPGVGATQAAQGGLSSTTKLAGLLPADQQYITQLHLPDADMAFLESQLQAGVTPDTVEAIAIMKVSKPGDPAYDAAVEYLFSAGSL